MTTADLVGVAGLNLGVNFPQPLPLGSIVLGASFRLDTAPVGAGSLTLTLQRSAPAPGGTFLAAQQLVAAPLGYPNTLGAAGTLLANGAVAATGAIITPQLTLACDVNLNTLSALDVTGFIYFVTPAEFSLAP
jgi:hypothetical protein